MFSQNSRLCCVVVRNLWITNEFPRSRVIVVGFYSKTFAVADYWKLKISFCCVADRSRRRDSVRKGWISYTVLLCLSKISPTFPLDKNWARYQRKVCVRPREVFVFFSESEIWWIQMFVFCFKQNWLQRLPVIGVISTDLNFINSCY